MKVLLTGGGTGGHVYPALSVAEVLRTEEQFGPVELLFAGTRRGDVAGLAAAAGLRFVPIDAEAVRGKSPAALASSLLHLLRGTLNAVRLLRSYRPGATLATGGYASVPVSLASWLMRVPLVLYLPDVYPGWAVRLLAKFASCIAVSSEASLAHLPAGRAQVTGYPVRTRFYELERAEARRCTGLLQEAPFLLVTGATQGAQALNEAVFAALPRLLPEMLVLHQTGSQGADAALRCKRALQPTLSERYLPVAYIEDMPAAMVAAELALMRAGASALAEPPAAGLATILVPGTFAGGHQRHNAAFMAARGAALVLDESRLCELPELVLALLHNAPRLAAMRAAAGRMARPEAARAIATLVAEAAA